MTGLAPSTILFPVEIWAQIVYYLNNALSLLKTCRELFYSRCLWLAAVEAASRLSPLAAPPTQKLYNLDMEELQSLAKRTKHVRQTVQASHWQPKSVNCFDIQPVDQVLGHIVGTDVMFIHKPWLQGRPLQCWDIKKNTCLGSVDVNLRECYISTPFIKDEEYTFAVVGPTPYATPSPVSTSVVVITANYSKPDSVELTEKFRQIIPTPNWRNTCVTLCSESVGVLAHWHGAGILLGAIAHNNPSEFRFTVELEDESRAGWFKHRGSPLYSDDERCFLWSCPMTEGLRYTRTTSFPHPTAGSDGIYQLHPDSVSLDRYFDRPSFVYPAQSSMYGIRAISYPSPWFGTHLTFWRKVPPDSGQSDWLTCPSQFQNIMGGAGDPDDPRFSVPPSGKSILALTPCATFLPGVGDVYSMDFDLLMLGDDLPSTAQDNAAHWWTRHSLSVPLEVFDPDGVDLINGVSAFWDDHLGVMRLVHSHKIYSLFYA